jgi:hypothetical protein
MVLFFCLLFTAMPAFSEISFSGDQDGYIEEGEYLALSTITVRKGKTLTFAPGCVVRFMQYSGLVVEGTLKCYGQPGSPIVFTSANHRAALPGQKAPSPGPFDWNGITVVDSASAAVLEYTRVAYSTYGLDVKSPSALVKLAKAVFTENGHASVTVNGKQLDVKDNEPFTYSQPWPEMDTASAAKAAPAEKASAASAPVKKENGLKPAAWKMPVRIGLGVLAVGGICLAVFEHMQAEDNFKSYNDRKATSSVGQNEILTNQVNDYRHKNEKNVDLRNIGQIATGIAALGLCITFFF